MSSDTPLYPEYTLNHSRLPRALVFEFFGRQGKATRLDFDLVKARHFEPGTEELKKGPVR
ncbi:MAG: hypothetical protein LLG01_00675 [Planctomycetaceae bacterium]|nr:hypothetical protein [Planctomycetaceae bacterium]